MLTSGFNYSLLGAKLNLCGSKTGVCIFRVCILRFAHTFLFFMELKIMEVKLDGKQYEQLISYCLHNKNNGRLKYFWEISIKDVHYNSFLEWLGKCEDASLTYAFAVLKRYEGYRLLYGFTNFEVIDDFTIKCMDFKLENDNVLCSKFLEWKVESECFLLPFSLMGYFKVMDVIADKFSNIKPLKVED